MDDSDKKLAPKPAVLGLNVIAHDPYLDPAKIAAAGARPVEWDELLRTSDFISLHAPLLPSTRHIVNEDALAPRETDRIPYQYGAGRVR